MSKVWFCCVIADQETSSESYRPKVADEDISDFKKWLCTDSLSPFQGNIPSSLRVYLHKASLRQNGGDQMTQNNTEQLESDLLLSKLETTGKCPVRAECCSTTEVLKDGLISTSHSLGISSKNISSFHISSSLFRAYADNRGRCWIGTKRRRRESGTTTTNKATISKKSKPNVEEEEEDDIQRVVKEGNFLSSISFWIYFLNYKPMTARFFLDELSKVPKNETGNDFKPDEHGFVVVPAHPRLPTAKQSERFEISKKKTVTLMQRKKIYELKTWIQTIGSQKGSLYVHGLQGVGKSHALYYIVCLLRATTTNNTRVIYIPDCANWGCGGENRWYSFLRDSILDAFCNDEEIVEMCETSNSNDEMHELFLNQVPQWCSENSIKLYAIIDQHNSLSDDKRKKEPFESLEQQVSSIWKEYGATLVLSASANNHYYLKAVSTDQWPTHNFYSGFDDEEVRHWAAKHGFSGDPLLSDLKDLIGFDTTVPLYLHRYLKEHGPRPITTERLDAFETSLTEEIRTRNDGFLTEFSNRERTFVKAVEHMAAEIPIEKGDTYFLNSQFMWRDEKGLIRCTTPIARTCLIKAVRTTWNFFALAEQLFSNTADFTNDTKGRVVEAYITQRLSQNNSRSYQFPIRVLNRTERGFHDPPVVIQSGFTVVEFAGNRAPSNISWDCDRVLLPRNSNYPAIDFAYWEATKKCLTGFQVTVGKLSDHKKTHFFRLRTTGRSLADDWKVTTGAMEVRLVWIVSSRQKGDVTDEQVSTTTNPQFYCLLKDFEDTLVRLKDVRLR